MSTRGKLHNAAERGAKAGHGAAEHIKAAIQNLGPGNRKLPASRAAGRAKSSHAGPEQDRKSPPPNAKVRTGIVSVNGRDVGEMCCTGGRRPA